MSSHLTTLVNPYLQKPKPNLSTQGSTDNTKLSQITNGTNSKLFNHISSNMSQHTDDMSDTNDNQWQISTKTNSYPKHTVDNSPKLSDPFSNNMFNSLMESNGHNEVPSVQNAKEDNTQTTRKERELTVTFQLPSRNNLKTYPGRGISRGSNEKQSGLNSAQVSISITKPAATNIGKPIVHMKNQVYQIYTFGL
jgi:hypothetical protein